MENRYSSKKSPSFGYFLLICSAITIYATIGLPLLLDHYLSLITILILIFIAAIINILFLWIWRATYYFIKDEILIARSGPLKWRVPIKEITLIRLNQKTIGGTWKLTMSWNCIEIKYKKYGAIFISPEREDEFLNKLLQINSLIQIRPK